MATDHLQAPDIQASQNSKEVTANAAHNLLDRALNQSIQKIITVDAPFTITETRENIVIELTGTPGTARFLDMPDTNERFMTVVNNTNDVMTIRNSAGGGTGQPILAVGQATIFHYDGTDFFDYMALFLSTSTFLDHGDTPSTYANQSGKHVTVNDAGTALEFVGTTTKVPARLATIAALTLADDLEGGTDSLDGVALVTGDRVLVKDQADASENGVYVVTAGAPDRADDYDDDTDPIFGGTVAVVLGSQNSNTVWQLTTAGPYTIGSTNLAFAQAAVIELWTALTDTPSSYTDQSGKGVRVDTGEAALVFVPQTWKDPVVAATTASLTLADDVETGDSIDGITLAEFDRVLVKDQSSSEDGIYSVQTGAPPIRVDDMDDNSDVFLGTLIAVLGGTVNANTLWQHTAGTDIGVDTLVFTEVGGGVGNSRIIDTVQTTDATQTVLAAVSVASNKLITLRGWGTGYKDDDGDSFTFEVIASVQNEGGTTVEKGSIINTLDPDATGWSVDWVGDDGSDEGRLRVTGTAAETVDWRFEYDIQTVGA